MSLSAKRFWGNKMSYRIALIIGFLMFTCISAAAQEEAEELPKIELPITYVFERSDKTPNDKNLSGFVIAPTFKVAPRIGITVGSFSYRSSTRDNDMRTTSYEVGAGVGFTALQAHRIKFNLEFEVGYAHEREEEPAEAEIEFGDGAILVPTDTKKSIRRIRTLPKLRNFPTTGISNRLGEDTGFASRVATDNSAYIFAGFAIDVETKNKHLSFRLLRAGYKPTFFGEGHQDNFQVETGIILNFGFKKEHD